MKIRTFTESDGHRGWIYSAAVAPEDRRQGIAAQCMVTSAGAPQTFTGDYKH